MDPSAILRAGDSVIVNIEFNFVGQKQRFETSHRIADTPLAEKIMFGHCRFRKDGSDPSPLELHILNMDAISDHCNCCTEAVYHLGDLPGAENYSWPSHATQENEHINTEDLATKTTFGESLATEPKSAIYKQTPHDTSKRPSFLDEDGDGQFIEDETIAVQLEDGHENGKPSLQQHSLTPTSQDNYASSNRSFQISKGGTSDSWGQQSTSTRQAALTDTTSVDSQGVVIRTRGQAQQGPTLRTQTSGRVNHVRGREYPQEQDAYILSARTRAYSRSEKGNAPTAGSIEGAPCAGTEEYDKNNGNTSYPDEDDYPPLPFPDAYWTYDAEAENYFHVDREEDGQESRVWYPLEFL
ncbi:hypothetical protein PG993_015209 [Apiospora rasikravindrae]|uniref:Uncharacterized protein n=1 Tax=Apiospora rasikravindrae TaxID=990691 RepID=A0ABR1RQ12_9PEZI